MKLGSGGSAAVGTAKRAGRLAEELRRKSKSSSSSANSPPLVFETAGAVELEVEGKVEVNVEVEDVCMGKRSEEEEGATEGAGKTDATGGRGDVELLLAEKKSSSSSSEPNNPALVL